MTKSSINLAIADDHSLYRELLKEAMSSVGLFNVVCSVEDGRGLMTALATTNIDVVLLDIKMPHMSGIEVLKHIYEKYSNVKVIMLSCFEDDIYISVNACNMG
jgi:DNA-binding NarL/FixJ family response regulator